MSCSDWTDDVAPDLAFPLRTTPPAAPRRLAPLVPNLPSGTDPAAVAAFQGETAEAARRLSAAGSGPWHDPAAAGASESLPVERSTSIRGSSFEPPERRAGERFSRSAPRRRMVGKRFSRFPRRGGDRESGFHGLLCRGEGREN